ncbi:amidohydrolase family protein [Ottowia thiooxydans]|uniref:amidohydrolase family protein n=1 Tax=Ottowia thiooxydans TaxID=219182 RepID=UPI00048E0BF7|nr:amidohydrolase family protein [Ottowia thiooxydans]
MSSSTESLVAPPCQGPDRALRRPHFQMPRNAVDCHAHVFGPRARYPFSEERNYTPEDCTVEQYHELLEMLGIDRCVLVHGGANGTNNQVTLDAIRALGPRARGVAVIRPGLGRAALEAMHAGGMRGCRISSVVRGGASFDDLESLADEVGEFGWHVLLHLKSSNELRALVPRLKGISNAFVLDHLGHVRGNEGLTSDGFAAVMELLETDRCWVKLASLYRSSSEPYPHVDMLPLIHAVVRARPDRVIWGSNWPHPIYAGAMPNDADLVDLIPLWVPDIEVQHQMLVSNPSSLYGFD